jgi:hypothetical protein
MNAVRRTVTNATIVQALEHLSNKIDSLQNQQSPNIGPDSNILRKLIYKIIKRHT